MLTLTRLLKRLGACEEAMTWAKGRTVSPASWRACPDASWMLWIAVMIGMDRKRVVLAACACARTALKFVPKGKDRPRRAIETAEAWTRGEATIEEVRTAAAAAYASDAAASAYAYAADAAAYASDAYAYASDAAAYAADAAASAYAYAAASASDAARIKALKSMAVLVRKHIPWGAVKKALAARKEAPNADAR